MTRRLLCFALGLGVMLGAPNAGAQTPGAAAVAPPWGTVIVPGGFPALRHAAQLPGPVEDWRTIPVVVESSFAGLDGLRMSRSIGEYAALLRKLRRQALAVSPQRTFSLADRQQRRSEVDELLDTLGLEYDSRASAVRLRPDGQTGEAAVLLEKAGIARSDLLTRLNAGETVSVATVDSSAPLPLGLPYWQGRFDPVPPPHDVLFAIVASREMSSLYYGLLGLDNDTLLAVQTDTALAAALVRHALVLPVVADALRIERGRVVPPGGAETAAAWQELVGARLDRPAEFVHDLLRTDEGRLAHFYRTVEGLPPGTLRWIAGVPADRSKDAGGLDRVYAAFNAALQGWRADAMMRPAAFGPAEVLGAFLMRQGATPAGPAMRAFWHEAFESSAWPTSPERDLSGDGAAAFGAADLLQLVCPAGCDRHRLGVVTLIQREFPEPLPATLPQLLAVARCRLRYPALALEIERMRLADAAAYARLGAVASQLEGLDDPSRAIALVQFQSAVALLARLRAVGAPAAFVRDHALTLAALPVTRSGFDGGVIRWIDRLFVAEDGESLDGAVARMLAGHDWQDAGPSFEWEGVTYRVDIVTTQRARIRAGLEKFRANTLAGAAAIVRLSDQMPERIAAAGVDAFVAAVGEAIDGAADVAAMWTGAPIQFKSLRELPADVGSALRRSRSPDPRTLERSRQLLRAAADLSGADALAALIYALALEDLDSDFALSGELPRRHHLVPRGALGGHASPWAIPVEQYPDDGARYVSGALLALRAGIPQLARRRLTSTRPGEEPNMAPPMAAGLLRTAALAEPWTVRAQDLAAIQQAHARGRAIVAGWSTNGHGADHVAEAGISGPRAGWLRWRAEGGQPAEWPEDLTGLVRLGELASSPRSSWGSAQPPSACLCLAFAWKDRSGMGGSRDPEAVAARVLEPSLRVALELSRRGAPPALAPGVLSLLLTEVIDTAVLSHVTDELGIIAAVGRVPSVKFDDYIAAVAARGPLVRAGNGGGGSQ